MALSKLAKRRLTKLIDFMADLPAEANSHFNMEWWMSHRWNDHHNLRQIPAVSKKDLMTCGTSACALGWACTVPSFKRAGLTMAGDSRIFLHGKRIGSYATARKFFDINDDQSDSLFAGGDETPKKWAKRARKMMRFWQKQPSR